MYIYIYIMLYYCDVCHNVQCHHEDVPIFLMALDMKSRSSSWLELRRESGNAALTNKCRHIRPYIYTYIYIYICAHVGW